MTTEAEAKTKWCPFAQSRFANIDTGGGQGKFAALLSDDGKINLYCIGSQCMAWRLDRKQVVSEYDPQFKHALPENRRGYCGLAGKP